MEQKTSLLEAIGALAAQTRLREAIASFDVDLQTLDAICTIAEHIRVREDAAADAK